MKQNFESDLMTCLDAMVPVIQVSVDPGNLISEAIKEVEEFIKDNFKADVCSGPTAEIPEGSHNRRLMILLGENTSSRDLEALLSNTVPNVRLILFSHLKTPIRRGIVPVIERPFEVFDDEVSKAITSMTIMADVKKWLISRDDARKLLIDETRGMGEDSKRILLKLTLKTPAFISQTPHISLSSIRAGLENAKRLLGIGMDGEDE